jgi:hypothetical protein
MQEQCVCLDGAGRMPRPTDPMQYSDSIYTTYIAAAAPLVYEIKFVFSFAVYEMAYTRSSPYPHPCPLYYNYIYTTYIAAAAPLVYILYILQVPLARDRSSSSSALRCPPTRIST